MTAEDIDAHERGLAAFLLPARRERFLDALTRPAARAKLAGDLWHFEHRIDPACATGIPSHLPQAEVAARLAAAGAPARCVALMADGPDACEEHLGAVLATLLPVGAGLISCVPGRLALYVGEDGSPVLLLTRPA